MLDFILVYYRLTFTILQVATVFKINITNASEDMGLPYLLFRHLHPLCASAAFQLLQVRAKIK